MKIVYIREGCHHKNHHALITYTHIELVVIQANELDTMDLTQFDCVLSPYIPIDVSKYPTTKFIFGPHFSVFPDNQLNRIKGTHVVYNQLSDWVVNVWKSCKICDDLRLVKIPFGIDTDVFCSNIITGNRTTVFVYFKDRHPAELKTVCDFLSTRNIQYKIFSYKNRYREEDYIEFLKKSKYGIWVGRHESQGFALQEALSCNVPLLVWNVTSMNQEYGSRYNNIPATTTPYWDDRCGEHFYNETELHAKFELFQDNISKNLYNPREFIVDTLSMDVCEQRLMNEIHNIP